MGMGIWRSESESGSGKMGESFDGKKLGGVSIAGGARLANRRQTPVLYAPFQKISRLKLREYFRGSTSDVFVDFAKGNLV